MVELALCFSSQSNWVLCVKTKRHPLMHPINDFTPYYWPAVCTSCGRISQAIKAGFSFDTRMTVEIRDPYNVQPCGVSGKPRITFVGNITFTNEGIEVKNSKLTERSMVALSKLLEVAESTTGAAVLASVSIAGLVDLLPELSVLTAEDQGQPGSKVGTALLWFLAAGPNSWKDAVWSEINERLVALASCDFTHESVQAFLDFLHNLPWY